MRDVAKKAAEEICTAHKIGAFDMEHRDLIGKRIDFAITEANHDAVRLADVVLNEAITPELQPDDGSFERINPPNYKVWLYIVKLAHKVKGGV